MNSFMLLQIGSGSECFVTFVARIRFIARMNALVSDQVANLCIFVRRLIKLT
jgi:hypothetical protein